MSGQAAIEKADEFFASAVAPGDNTTIGTDRRYFVKFTYEDLCSAYSLRDCQIPAPSDWGMADVVGCLEWGVSAGSLVMGRFVTLIPSPP